MVIIWRISIQTTIKNYNELQNELDMLKGNINRLCISDSVEELESHIKYAKLRLENIYAYRYNQMSEKDC